MSQILNGEWLRHDTNKDSKGGTELLMERLFNSLQDDVKNEVQIIASRMPEELDESKVRIYWCHDLIGDPACDAALRNDGWRRFHRIVFVSYWQMNKFIDHYHIPWSKCVVIQNGIVPIERHKKDAEGPVRLIYYSTPHRGLELLVPVFEKLSEEHDVELDVYSSFSLYGWGERDEPYKPVFERCEKHPKIHYHGAVDNDEIREAIQSAHILAYPSIWQETSCMVLMEAMSGGLLCVHPTLAALPETASGWTNMYQYHEDPNFHANLFYNVLSAAVKSYRADKDINEHLMAQKMYADAFYNWMNKARSWDALIRSHLKDNRSIPKEDISGQIFEYSS